MWPQHRPRAPDSRALDLNFLKEFKLRGNSRIQARWEIFNVTNRVNLGTFQSTSTRSCVFGQIGSTPDVDRGNPVHRIRRSARDAVGVEGVVLIASRC